MGSPADARALGSALRSSCPRLEELCIEDHHGYIGRDNYEHVIAGFAESPSPSAAGPDNCSLRNLQFSMEGYYFMHAHIDAIAKLNSLQSLYLDLNIIDWDHSLFEVPSLTPLTALTQLQDLNTDHHGPLPEGLTRQLRSLSAFEGDIFRNTVSSHGSAVSFSQLQSLRFFTTFLDDFETLLSVLSNNQAPLIRTFSVEEMLVDPFLSLLPQLLVLALGQSACRSPLNGLNSMIGTLEGMKRK